MSQRNTGSPCKIVKGAARCRIDGDPVNAAACGLVPFAVTGGHDTGALAPRTATKRGKVMPHAGAEDFRRKKGLWIKRYDKGAEFTRVDMSGSSMDIRSGEIRMPVITAEKISATTPSPAPLKPHAPP